MAYKDSETLQAGTPYALGDYSFNCVFDDSPTLGQFARASMSKDGQTVYKTVSLPNNSRINGWTVEANETTADVYAVINSPEEGTEYISDLDTSPVAQPIPTSRIITLNGLDTDGDPFTSTLEGDDDADFMYYTVRDYPDDPGEYRVTIYKISANRTEDHSKYEHNGKYVESGTSFSMSIVLTQYEVSGGIELPLGATIPRDEIAWTILYGKSVDPEYKVEEILVGRFAIDIEDAGGVGPGSDWTDPEDYDEDWEEGDPTHTLYVTVTGALSGRHNDPIEDPSYSYIPADKDTVKDYGCGGDGGHGGGGGAGASTVVVQKFATNQANSKEVTAIARRHGYGSGGGKGGKGGDGCILVYY